MCSDRLLMNPGRHVDRAVDAPVVGLRIDVDTLRGTRLGVPRLLDLMGRQDIRASFFFSVGPDNMGRHLWRLARPRFFCKMLRSRAPSLYGWDILLRGTVGPGPLIGRRLRNVIRTADRVGHEIGLHAWDHHRWQTHVAHMSRVEIRQELRRGVETLSDIVGRSVTCFAAPGWRSTVTVLEEQRELGLTYHSDCRGHSIFRPLLHGVPQTTQIPATLPTYDELIGRHGVCVRNYNERLLRRIEPGRLNVLTVHAEVEGIGRADLFASFVETARRRGIAFVPLGHLLPDGSKPPCGAMQQGAVEGRDGWVTVQTG